MQRCFPDKLLREAEVRMPCVLCDQPAVLFSCLAVDEEYQGRKIASQLIKVALELLEEKNYSFATIHSFNHFTKKAAENAGFEAVHSVNAREFLWKNVPLYANILEPHGDVTRLIKTLK